MLIPERTCYSTGSFALKFLIPVLIALAVGIYYIFMMKFTQSWSYEKFDPDYKVEVIQDKGGS